MVLTPAEPPRTRTRRLVIGWPAGLCLAVVLVAANTLGAIAVTVLALWLVPIGPPLPVDSADVKLLNVLVVIGYVFVAVPLSLLLGGLSFRLSGDDPERERRLVLRGPLRLATVQAVFWLIATVLFGVLNAGYSWRLGVAVAETVLIVGITTGALSYLVAERILRPAAARVLAADPPRLRHGGVLGRSVVFWVLGTAVPVTGLMSAALGALVFDDVPAATLAVAVLAGGAGSLLAGFVITVGAARAVADPVASVRRAMHRVEQGDMDVSVPVYDGTELGGLQAGFNTMAAGLRERERIRELFARQVGRDVARATTAEQEVRLGGEVRPVAVLFVDLVGSTALAGRRPPTEVVALLNRFFAVVVEAVEQAGGWINKFEGDAALAVFGAPAAHHDPAGAALAAGRRLAERLAADLPDASAGIGISAGDAVAGYVGDVRRFEYTVIGDPVNEAARLTELAKSVPGGMLAAESAVRLAAAAESCRWELGDSVVLRGRDNPTRLATPMPEAVPADDPVDTSVDSIAAP
ncbi:MAG: adenylate/guanylate cyclase domain-containing protein [Pseudonocardia sp.]